MGSLQALLLGLIGGLTDIFPVSSSGHRLLAGQMLFGSPYDRTFTGACELASALAALVALRREVGSILGSLRVAGSEGRQVGLLLLAAALPAALLSLPFRDASVEVSRNLGGVGVLLLVSGLLLYVAEELGRRSRPLTSLSVPGAILVGLLQVLAVMPGVSRTGFAISGAMLAGITREAATRFALLLSIPLLLFTGLWDLSYSEPGGSPAGAGDFALGMAASFAAAYAAVRLLLLFVHRFSLMTFAYYLWGVGLVTIVYVTLR